MSRDTKLRDENGGEWSLDNLKTNGYLLGQAVGWEEAAAWLRGLSGESYAQGNDALAKLQRDLATLAEAKGKTKREAQRKHEKEYPDEWDKT